MWESQHIHVMHDINNLCLSSPSHGPIWFDAWQHTDRQKRIFGGTFSTGTFNVSDFQPIKFIWCIKCEYKMCTKINNHAHKCSLSKLSVRVTRFLYIRCIYASRYAWWCADGCSSQTHFISHFRSYSAGNIRIECVHYIKKFVKNKQTHPRPYPARCTTHKHTHARAAQVSSSFESGQNQIYSVRRHSSKNWYIITSFSDVQVHVRACTQHNMITTTKCAINGSRTLSSMWERDLDEINGKSHHISCV